MIKKLTLCTLLTTVTSAAFANNSVELKVIGNISPVACNVNLGGGGTIDYGNISPEALDEKNYTTLQAKEVPLQINCDAPVKLGIKVKADRPGTAPGGTQYPNGSNALIDVKMFNQVYFHGLGLSNGNKIGGYTMVTDTNNTTADGIKVKPITRQTQNTWRDVSDGQLIYVTDDYMQSWSDPAKTEPLSFKQLNTTLKVGAYIDKKENLDLKSPVKLDGMSTIELVYL